MSWDEAAETAKALAEIDAQLAEMMAQPGVKEGLKAKANQEKPTTGKHVLLATPSYTGMVAYQHHKSVMGGTLALADNGIRVSWTEDIGNAMIAHCRDVLCAYFLTSDATDLIFIDDDVTFQPADLLKLARHPGDIVGGVYPYRKDPLGFPIRFIDPKERPELQADLDTMLLEVAGVPAGFCKITRDCLTKMVFAYPEKRFKDAHAPNGYAWALFDNIHDGDMYFGEDYSFCERARKIGCKVWCDPEMELGHVGMKHFTGKFGDWLRAKANGVS